MNPRDRATAEQTLNHDWIKTQAPSAAGVALHSGFVDSLRGFRSMNKFKKAALHVIATQLNDNEIKKLRDIFISMDKNADGTVTFAELKEGVEKSGLKDIPSDFQDIWAGVDSGGSGQIDYADFLAATLDKKTYVQEQTLWAAFRDFDKNGDGRISREELEKVLLKTDASDQSRREIMEVLKNNDSDGDGMISFDEFAAMMKKDDE